MTSADCPLRERNSRPSSSVPTSVGGLFERDRSMAARAAAYGGAAFAGLACRLGLLARAVFGIFGLA